MDAKLRAALEITGKETLFSNTAKTRTVTFSVLCGQPGAFDPVEDRAVELYERSADFWKYTIYEGLDATIELTFIGISLSLAAIYEGI